MSIQTVTVIGANGTMGCNVSALFASFGGAKVYMVSRDIEQSRKAVARAVKSVRADSIAANLVPADYSMLEQCIRKSDLVFESVAESLEVKLEVAHRIAMYANSDTILATGSSGLSIKTLAESYPYELRKNFFGVHMFNPPYSLTLCEVIRTPYSDNDLFGQLRSYLDQILHRAVVEVKDRPAFLGNRIGFQFINRAMQFAEKYQYSGGIDYIDAILGTFTGRAMPPIVTADFVGLDVHKAIVNNIRDNTVDYDSGVFELPAYVQTLIAEKQLGRKSGCGLYKKVTYENDTKRTLVYDITTKTYRDKLVYEFPFAVQMKEALREGDYEHAFYILITNRSAEADICSEFLLQYIVYSLYASKSVGYDVHGADDVMAMGFNWCPPLAMADALSTVTDLKTLVKKRLAPKMLEAINVDALLEMLEPSHYDYRPYFKSI